VGTCDEDTGDFHSQDSEVNVFVDSVVVEAVVGIC
jgi:hypothetical protein